VTQEREGQVVGVADPLDPAFGRRGDLLKGLAGQVAISTPLRLDQSGSTGFNSGA
jgi:hypothetical protein